MPEKHLYVTHGQPMTPPSKGESNLLTNPYGPISSAESNDFDREGPLGQTGKFGKGAQGALDNWANANYDAITASIRNNFHQALSRLPQLLAGELSAIGGHTAGPGSPVNAYIHELQLRQSLIGRKHAELARQIERANAFYGSDPISKTAFDLVLKWQPRAPLGPIKEAWANAYTAAYNAQLLTAGIQALSAQADELNTTIAQRADELTRIEAQAQARRAAEAQARARARADAAAHAKRLADEQARASAQAEADRIAAIAAATAVPTLLPGATTVAPFIEAAGSLIQAAVRAAISAIGAATAGVSAGLTVGIGALMYSSKVGNGELPEHYGLGLPLSDLGSDPGADLNAVAAVGGTVELPYRITLTISEPGQTELSVVSTAGDEVSSKVQVVNATFDSARKAYISTTADVPPLTVIWTPIVTPADSSTASPAVHIDIPVYTGAAATPVVTHISALPGISTTFQDLILVLPAESGIPPIYLVFNSPYPGATTKGEHSGRFYNPANAGGATLNLDWKGAVITQGGIDLVKLHTSRFDASPSNDVMIERLGKIVTGELAVTDTDKRYYTHEIRELERSRALGVADGETPEGGDSAAEAWNNAHTATLEDYKLLDDPSTLYTFDALNPKARQENP